MTNAPNILLVEDNEDDVILVQRALRKAGIDAPLQVLRDGDEAIEYLGGSGRHAATQARPVPSMLLLDLRLPRRSGLEVLAWIRAHPDLAALPVVVFTTSTQESDLTKAYELGVNSYLKKPIGVEETAELMRTAGAYWLTHNVLPRMRPLS